MIGSIIIDSLSDIIVSNAIKVSPVLTCLNVWADSDLLLQEISIG